MLGRYTQRADYDQWYQLKAEKGPFTASYDNESLSNIRVKNGSSQELKQPSTAMTSTATALEALSPKQRALQLSGSNAVYTDHDS